MGRRKQITDDELITLIDRYYIEHCEENTRLLKTSLICDYIRANGYPNYKEYIFRRSAVATEHINKIISSKDSDDIAMVSVYKTIDADEFIAHNHSPSAMKKSLVSLDAYYRKISNKATKIFDENKELKGLLCKAEIRIKELETGLKSSQEDLFNAKSSIKALTVENASYKKIIDTYVYPEVANELLKQSGLLKNTGDVIKAEAMDTEIVRADTPVKSESNIIQGLFDRIEE